MQTSFLPRLSILALALVAALAATACNPQEKGDYGRWRVLFCKLADIDTIPPETATVDALFDGVEGLRQYYRDISYGAYDPEFVRDGVWRTVPQTQAQDAALGRYERITNCMKAHGESGDGYDGVIVFRNSAIDGGSAGGQVLADRGGWNVTFLAHETGHGLGLGHSFDFSDRKNSSWSAPGEYFDYWDIMSAMAVYDFANANGFTAGPDMTISSKMLLGWLPNDKLKSVAVPAPGKSLQLTLSRYDDAKLADPLGAVIDYGGADFYTIEFRKKAGWDRAIPRDGVLVHKVMLTGRRPYIIDGGELVPGESYVSPDGFRIDVTAFAADGNSVTLTLLPTTTAATAEQAPHVTTRPLIAPPHEGPGENQPE